MPPGYTITNYSDPAIPDIVLRPATPEDEFGLRLRDFVPKCVGRHVELHFPNPQMHICSPKAVGHLEVPQRRRRRARIREEEADWKAFPEPEVHLDPGSEASYRAYTAMLK
jgi:hypothetical protein